jgi:hypothetical protein
VNELIIGYDIAINALDFKSDIPFVFDKACKKNHIPVLHPYNFGWGGFLTVVKPDSLPLTMLSEEYAGFELKMAEYVLKYLKFWNCPKDWLEEVICKFKKEDGSMPPPQLSIASWITAGYCVNVMYNIVTGKKVKIFPEFYLTSIYE